MSERKPGERVPDIEPSPELTAARAEVERLREKCAKDAAEIAELKAELADMKRLKLKSLAIEPGRFDATMQSDLVMIFAGALAESFKGAGGVNFVEYEVMHAELGPLTLSMQRRLGKTPVQMHAEAVAELAAARAEAERLRGELSALRDGLPNWYLKSLPSAPAQPAAGEQPTQGDDDGTGTVGSSHRGGGSMVSVPADVVGDSAGREVTPAPADAQEQYTVTQTAGSSVWNVWKGAMWVGVLPSAREAEAYAAFLNGTSPVHVELTALRSQVEAMRRAIMFVPDGVIAHPKKGQWYRNLAGDFVCAKRDHEGGEMAPLFQIETPAAQI